jgi:hypothetical protein
MQILLTSSAVHDVIVCSKETQVHGHRIVKTFSLFVPRTVANMTNPETRPCPAADKQSYRAPKLKKSLVSVFVRD